MMCRLPSSNLALFCNEMSQLLNYFNSNNILLAGNYVMNTAKPGVPDYLNVLSGFALKNAISDFTREETMGNKITNTCVDPILMRLDDFIVVPGIIREKVADHYFAGVTMLP